MEVTWAGAVDSTADAAFIVSAQGRVTAWNAGIAQLLGVPSATACGRPCHELLQGRSVLGEAFCGASCPVRRAAARQVPIGAHALVVRDASGADQLVRQTVLRIGEPRAFLHVLAPLAAPTAEGLAASPAPLRSSELTPRENEVLACLEEGLASAAIAERLSIAEATARHHVEHVLRKLGVHNRGQAVRAARDAGRARKR